jgi:hypothetical protein
MKRSVSGEIKNPQINIDEKILIKKNDEEFGVKKLIKEKIEENSIKNEY